MDWEVTGGGGHETVVAIASTDPLADLERDIAAFPPARAGAPIHYGRLSDRALESLRSLGGPGAPQALPTRSAGRLSRLVRDVLARPRDGGPWIWKIELENSG